MPGKIKMQNVSFRNVDEFLEFLPEDELKIVGLLRKIVFTCAPDAFEKLTYNVPFYKYHKNFCFIWPASVLWGKKRTFEGVRFGFPNGHLLTDEMNYLEKGKRKFFYWKNFKKPKDVDTEILKSYIFEALAVDEELNRKK